MGFVIGLCVGALAGFTFAALCVASKNAERVGRTDELKRIAEGMMKKAEATDDAMEMWKAEGILEALREVER